MEPSIRTGYAVAGHRSELPDGPLSRHGLRRRPGACQVGSLSQVSAGTFYADYANHRLYIGDNPAGRTVEAAAQPYALQIQGDSAAGSKVLGLGFEHYASGYSGYLKAPLAIYRTPSVTVQDNTFAWNAMAGLNMAAPDGIVRGNTAAFNGELGASVWRADRTLLEGNVFAYNNQEHFNTSWETGGVKDCTSRDMVVRGNLSDSNIGQGFWFDISCYNTTIVGNVSRNDVGGGIQYEISAKAIIASNLVVGSHAEGIKVGAGSSDVRVYNNTLVRDKRAICVLDDSRPELTNNVTIRNNIISNGAPDSSEMVFTYDSSSPPKTAEQMNITLDYDAYYRTSSSRPATLVRWSRGATLASFNTLGAFRLGTGQEAHGFGIDDVAINPFFVDEAGGDYRLKAGSRAIGAGAPLPADVAAAIGVAAGVPVDLGVLTW